MRDSNVASDFRTWVVLVPQLPPKPDYLRVKLQRRLKRIGAVALRGSAYVLPAEATGAFERLRDEIIDDGGEPVLWRAVTVFDVDDERVCGLFSDRSDTGKKSAHPKSMVGKTWVTREGVFVDRIASAWLIRRFIDPRAAFKFVAPGNYSPKEGEVRFDMPRGEFTHTRDRCTFETLVAQFELSDPALAEIAEIVHDIDCKDEKFERAEASGVAAVLAGLARAHVDDRQRIEAGSALFESLYLQFGGVSAGRKR